MLSLSWHSMYFDEKNSFCTADYFDQMQKNGTRNT